MDLCGTTSSPRYALVVPHISLSLLVFAGFDLASVGWTLGGQLRIICR